MRTIPIALLVISLLPAATIRGRTSVRGVTATEGKTGTVTTINYVPIIGQSLALGTAGTPVLSTTQTYNNLMFVGGVRYPTSIATLKALVESGNETIASGFANELSALRIAAGGTYPGDATIMASWGVNGAAYSALAKGTTPYNDSLASVTSALTIYPSPVALKVPGILVIHGEADQGNNYTANIYQWQADYQPDINALTGRSDTIPMFHTQVDAAFSVTMVEAYEGAPTTTILVGPKYFLPYVASPHPYNTSYRTLGEYYAKAYYTAVVRGQTYSPLRPSSVTRSGATVTVQMAGQVGNLVNDCTSASPIVSDPSTSDTINCAHCPLGFEWSDSTSSAFVSSVAITDAVNGIVTVTLNTTPTGNSKNLRYAYSGNASTRGPTTGVRGCVRDSDPTVGVDGYLLYNWLVHFEKAAT